MIPAQYEYANHFSDGLARVGVSGGDSFIDKTGKRAFEATFEFAGDFVDGRAPVRLKETQKYGFIDKAGKLVIPAEYDGAEEFANGFAAVWKGKYNGFVDSGGKVVVPIQYKGTSDFGEGLSAVVVDDAGQLGYVDGTGKLVIPAKFKAAGGTRDSSRFAGGLALVDVDGRWTYIDRAGTVVWQAAK